ncbi:hypothetical protein NPIL_564291 [Nephila pilipes]|uniref:Uncharacterized protein n=1 Tax=Nephila pilipes TaxID=299642 RepID=A0A8X6U121_NEPPI|nr:hypothetical protein NPIL_564291 [Nephila pilipes]
MTCRSRFARGLQENTLFHNSWHRAKTFHGMGEGEVVLPKVGSTNDRRIFPGSLGCPGNRSPPRYVTMPFLARKWPTPLLQPPFFLRLRTPGKRTGEGRKEGVSAIWVTLLVFISLFNAQDGEIWRRLDARV